MTPTPRRDSGWTCGCGSWNESFRTHCRNCQAASRAIVPFEFPATGQPVRTVMVDGRPWILAADVCAVLDITNVGNALARLDDDEKGYIRLTDGTPGTPVRAIVNESGLYSLVIRSDKPEARAFRRWVTHDVLPAIRQTGKYEARPALPQTHAEALRALADEVEQHEKTRKALGEARPKADSWDVLASGEGDFSVSDAAKILARDPAISIGRDRLFAYLHEIGWAYRQQADGRWRAYQRHVDIGRLSELPQQYENKQTGQLALAAPQLRITVKGLADLHRLLGGTGPLHLEGGA